jgi:hypothetical protein
MQILQFIILDNPKVLFIPLLELHQLAKTGIATTIPLIAKLG